MCRTSALRYCLRRIGSSAKVRPVGDALLQRCLSFWEAPCVADGERLRNRDWGAHSSRQSIAGRRASQGIAKSVSCLSFWEALSFWWRVSCLSFWWRVARTSYVRFPTGGGLLSFLADPTHASQHRGATCRSVTGQCPGPLRARPTWAGCRVLRCGVLLP